MSRLGSRVVLIGGEKQRTIVYETEAERPRLGVCYLWPVSELPAFVPREGKEREGKLFWCAKHGQSNVRKNGESNTFDLSMIHC